MVAVGLGQALGLDDGGHGTPSGRTVAGRVRPDVAPMRRRVDCRTGRPTRVGPADPGGSTMTSPSSPTPGRLGPLLEHPQMRLDPAGQRGPAQPHEDAGPAIERLEGGRVDDPRPAGDRFQPPAPFAVEAGAVTRTRKRESGRASRLSTRAVVAQQPEPGVRRPRRRGRRPRRRGRPEPQLREEHRVSGPGRAASPRPRAGSRGRRRAARRRHASDGLSARLSGVPPPVPTAIVSRRSGARPSSSRGRRRSIRGVRRRRRRASRSGPRRPSSSGATGA